MDVYMIVLEGGGDVFVRLVDKETWDWINDEHYERDEKNGNDLLIPLNVRKYLWERSGKKQYGHEVPLEDYLVLVTGGSYNNDRAMESKGIIIDGEEADFWDEREAEKFATKHNLTIIDKYEGCFY